MGILRRILLVCLLLPGSVMVLSGQDGVQSGRYDSYLGVKAYRLRLIWMGGDGWQKQETIIDNCWKRQTLKASMAASVSYKLVLARVSRGGVYQWRTEKKSLPQGQFSYLVEHEARKSKCKDSPEAWSRMTHSGGGIGEGEGRLDIDSRTGDYRIYGYLVSSEGSVRTESGPDGEPSMGPGGMALGVGVNDMPGLPSDITGTLKPGGKYITGPMVELPWTGVGPYCRKPVTLKWSVERWEDEDEPEILVEPLGYDTWRPLGNLEKPEDPGEKPLRVRVSVSKPGDGSRREAHLVFTLQDISEETGVCLNYPPKGQAKKGKGIRFRQEDYDSAKVVVRDPAYAATVGLAGELELALQAYDYGAWATLHVSGTDANDKPLKVKILGKEAPEMKVPQDDNDNHIADGWESGEAKGKPKDWDGESTTGQDNKGDSVSLYDEYRGIAVLEGGKPTWQSLSGTQKEIFLVDPSRVFPYAKWEELTGIKAIRVDESLVDPSGNPGPGESPLLNYNASDLADHPVFALKVVQGPPREADNLNPACAVLPQEGLPWCVRNAEAVYVDPARFLARVEEDFKWLDTALNVPGSQAAKELGEDGPRKQLPYDEVVEAYGRLKDPSVRAMVAGKLLMVGFLHEVGHICSLQDHRGDAPAGEEDWARSCLMFNQGDWGRRRTIVHTALGRGDALLAYPYTGFCSQVQAVGYRCYKSLRVTDCGK